MQPLQDSIYFGFDGVEFVLLFCFFFNYSFKASTSLSLAHGHFLQANLFN